VTGLQNIGSARRPRPPRKQSTLGRICNRRRGCAPCRSQEFSGHSQAVPLSRPVSDVW